MLTNTDPQVTNRLRQIRRAQGLPMYGLAVRASVSPTIIGMVERFDYRPGQGVRQRIAAALALRENDIWPENLPETAA
jgi:transcriptional regulator with XRE-family HTH domain